MASNNLPSSQFCVFCYRNYSSIIPDDKTESLNIFSKLLGRYLGDAKIDKTFDLKSVTSLSSCKIGCCLDCSCQMDQFSNIYHQYKCSELKLQWQIFKLVNLIKLANKVPSRISQLKKAIEESHMAHDGQETKSECDTLKQLQNFRKGITKKCCSKLAKSQPRVILSAKSSLPNILLPKQNIVCVLDSNTPSTAPAAIINEIIIEPEKEVTAIDISSASRRNSFIAVDQQETLTNDLSLSNTKDGDPICSTNKLIINKTETTSCANNDFNPWPADCDTDSPNADNISEVDTSEPITVNNLVVIENSPPVCFEEDTLEDTHSLPDCDEDPLNYDNIDEVDIMEYDDGDGAEFANDILIPAEHVVTSLAQPPENNISTQEEMLLSPSSITIEPTFVCRPHFKTESNTVNHTSLESETLEYNGIHSEDIIANGEINEMPTESITDNPNQNRFNMEQNLTTYSTDIEGQQTSSLNEELTTTHMHQEDEDIESDTNNVNRPEPQKRYNLRNQPAPNFSQQLENDSSDNDIDQEFSDTNSICSSVSSSSPSSSNSFSDLETTNPIETSSALNQKRFKRKVKIDNRTQSSVSKEIDTITCPDGCGKVFQNEQMYENHLKLHLSGQFSCSFCPVVLNTVIDLSTHEYKDHCPNDFNIDKQKQCPRCLLKFDFPFEYEEHFAYVHFGIGDNPTREMDEESMPSTNKKNFFRCCADTCNKKFADVKIYRDHKKLHLNGVFPCNFCKYLACSVINLANHELKKHRQSRTAKGKEKQCPRCLLKFKYSFDNEDHFAYTHFGIGENPDTKEKRRGKGKPKKNVDDILPLTKKNNLFHCRIDGCHKNFRKEKIYRDHIKLHSNGAFSCNFCKYLACSVTNLSNHELKKHCQSSTAKGKEKECPRCLLKFKYSFDYEEHFAYTHFGIGENPETKQKRRRVGPPKKLFDDSTTSSNNNLFHCRIDGCHKTFRNEKIYLDHKKLHSSGKFPCSFCKTVATNLINLANHEHKKHCKNKTDIGKEKECPRCLLKFKYSFDYEDHFAYTHYGVGENPETKQKRRGKGQPRSDSTHLPNETQNVPVIICKVCKRKMPKTYKASHMKKWHNTTNDTKLKRCKYENCQAYFLTDKQLHSHSNSHREDITTFFCNTCQLSFSGRLLLRRHMLQKHNQSVPQEIGSDHQPNQIQCNFCDFTTNVPRKLAIHEEKEHVLRIEDDLSTNSKKLRCPRCPYKYEVQACYITHHLTKHLNVLTINSPNACKLCSGKKSFVQNSIEHFNKLHNVNLLEDPTKLFKCDVQDCPAYFVKSRQLYCHKTTTHPMLNCLKCVKTFKTRYKLLQHLRLCQKPYDVEDHPNLSVSCDNTSCTKMFHSEEEMKMHMIYAHPKNPKKSVEKNEICPKCEKRFISVRMLKSHLQKVHMERSFVCSECGKVFGAQHILIKHMIFHKGPDTWEYQCTECGKKCVDKQKLDEHMRTHTKEKPFVCQFCGGKYAHRHNWRNHLKAKHGDEEGVEEIVGSGKKGNYMSRKGSKKGVCIISSSQSV